MSHLSLTVALWFTGLLAVRPAVHLSMAVAPRQRSGAAWARALESFTALTAATGDTLLSGTWLWHPDLPTFPNPQMEEWHLK